METAPDDELIDFIKDIFAAANVTITPQIKDYLTSKLKSIVKMIESNLSDF